MSNNRNLQHSQKNPNDEYYTKYSEIQAEIESYSPAVFRNKVVYCPCDYKDSSKFVKYFKSNFNKLGLKKLIATNYTSSIPMIPSERYGVHPSNAVALCYTLTANGEKVTPLKGDGDFRSAECSKYFKEADIVVTNPPFSGGLPKELLLTCIKYNCLYLFVNTGNNIAGFYTYILDSHGHGGNTKMSGWFETPSYKNEKYKSHEYEHHVATTTWVSNLDTQTHRGYTPANTKPSKGCLRMAFDYSVLDERLKGLQFATDLKAINLNSTKPYAVPFSYLTYLDTRFTIIGSSKSPAQVPLFVYTEDGKIITEYGRIFIVRSDLYREVPNDPFKGSVIVDKNPRWVAFKSQVADFKRTHKIYKKNSL